MRVFRGCTTTEHNRCGYAFPKDCVYFEGKALVSAMNQNGLRDLTDFSIMTTDDLCDLWQVMELDADGLKYQYPKDLLTKMYEKVMGGDFTS